MLRAERFTLERDERYAEPVLAIATPTGVSRFLVADPQQLFLEVVSVLGPWLQQPGVLPEVKAGGELFDQFREVMSDLLETDQEKEK